jgi:hypothetical protein
MFLCKHRQDKGKPVPIRHQSPRYDGPAGPGVTRRRAARRAFAHMPLRQCRERSGAIPSAANVLERLCSIIGYPAGC